MKTANSEDLEKFKKLGVSSLLKLAMILPCSYESSYIDFTPRFNEINSVEVEILSVKKTPKALILQLFCKTWNQRVSGVIFKPSSYHTKVFGVGKSLYIRGKIEYKNGWVQIIQPQIINHLNQIIPKYKTKLQNQTVISLMKRYITVENLLKEGLDIKEADVLYLLHNPTKEFYNEFTKNGYSKEIVKVLKYVEILSYLKELSYKNIKHKAKSILNGDYEKFIKNLPFKLTNDQQKVIDEIRKDFLSRYASKRVIMGDVGSGKTMVILSSVMMAYPKRSILMAPTTVLATQIYEEAIKYLSPLHVKITLVTNSSKKEDLSGYDFIIGTHALLYRELPEVDLVMVDEQHRFGTKQRVLISTLMKKENQRVHFLQFSATPIPRTLSLMHSSLVDFSYIKELPFKKEIDTRIISREDFPKLISHITKEIELNHQVIIVYPLVEESESIEYQSIEEGRAFWEKNFQNVYVTYGKDKEKEKILKEFRDKGDILVSTTVIEVGISLPRLTTIVLVAPERLGLASLHQLRGRVSRNGLKGYCFLYTNRKKDRRLEEFCKTLDGFEIAEMDLRYRKGGDIISGIVQSGISFNWFDIVDDIEILTKVKERLRGRLPV